MDLEACSVRRIRKFWNHMNEYFRSFGWRYNIVISNRGPERKAGDDNGGMWYRDLVYQI